jgi:PAT family beta-lactamase induction signal transducer AmpG
VPSVRNHKRECAVIQQWLKDTKIYLEPRIIAIGILGFFSGLPLPVTTSTLTFWLSKVGIDYTAVGLFALAGLPYVLKFLWSPLVDNMRLPLLTSFFGQRRGWMIFAQIGLMISFFGLAFSDPQTHLDHVAIWIFLVSIFSATQDIAIDAYRVEILNDHQYGAGAAIGVLGYRIGMLVSGAGAIVFASYYGWQTCFILVAIVMSLGIIAVLSQPEPFRLTGNETAITDVSTHNLVKRFGRWMTDTITSPLQNFMSKPYWALTLAFILIYKMSDAMIGHMATPFYNYLEFTPGEIAAAAKVFGLWATIAGGFIGGIIATRLSIGKVLFIGAILQTVSNGAYLILLINGHELSILYLNILVENICGGISTAALVAYLCHLCSVHFAATHFALMSALAAVPRTVFAASSGFLVDKLGWAQFFIATIVLGIPAIGLSWFFANKTIQHSDA